MSKYFMGIRTREFNCSSTEGDQLTLCAQNRECALFTAAELFNLPVTHVEVRYADEWSDPLDTEQEVS